MSLHKMLSILTSINDDCVEKFDNQLATKLHEITPLLTDEMKLNINSQIIRMQYLQALACVLHAIKQQNIEDTDAPFSTNQYRSLQTAVELMVSMGILPYLKSVKLDDMFRESPRTWILTEQSSCIEKYEWSSFTICKLTDLLDDQILRSVIFSHLGPIMAALLQLSYGPLITPTRDKIELMPANVNNEQFQMTIERYEMLQCDQKQFHVRFVSLLSNCPQYMRIRGLMMIHGLPRIPKWLRKRTRSLLINEVVQSDGVQALIATVCEDGFDIGEDWSKVNVISRLLATSHRENPDEYYRAVCPQILNLFSSDTIGHGPTIARSCIAALYNYNPSICHKHIAEIMYTSLITTESSVGRSEEEVEQCVKTLAKCFLAENVKFERPPCKLILDVAKPLFSLYNNVRQTACILKKDLQQLVLKLLEEKTSREELYSTFLGHDISVKFGNHVTSKLGPSHGIQITGLNKDLKYEEMADTVFDLVSITEDLSSSLFSYVLKFLLNINKWNDGTEQREMLETEDDKMERFEIQLAAYMLLSRLANMITVQDAQAKNPEQLLSFIKLLFDKYNESQRDEMVEDNECNNLYLGLLLIKTIVVEKRATIKVELFKNFIASLKNYVNSRIPEQCKLLINEVVECVETRGESERANYKNYQDLSINSTTTNKFQEAIKDLADPLLPVRGHGIITLTRLIENQDPCAIANQECILSLFLMNLEHEDSFIYLASINGLCALATTFPRVVIETLVREYINMPNRVAGTEICAETRIKLGEILVKTTRTLGEMSIAHKNLLINGFLCAVRDTDPLVRASSLSCLGELCKVLGFRLGNTFTEILYCITNIVKHDRAPECRRAAVLVVTLLFRGLGKDTLSSLNNHLVGLYRVLIELHRYDQDLVLRLHAQEALTEIHEIVKEFLYAKPEFEKMIVMPNHVETYTFK